MKVCCRTLTRVTKSSLENMALQLSKEGRHSEACEMFEKRVALSPDNPMIWNDLGNEYAAAGQFEKAISALKRGHAAYPDYPLPLYNLGKHTLDRCQELQNAGVADQAQVHTMASEAIRYFNACLERDPGNADCHRNIAIAYRMIRDTEAAGAHMMEALRLNPELRPPAKGLLGRTLKLLSK
jgi:tetratricopeptide (TPR) repeat protein